MKLLWPVRISDCVVLRCSCNTLFIADPVAGDNIVIQNEDVAAKCPQCGIEVVELTEKIYFFRSPRSVGGLIGTDRSAAEIVLTRVLEQQ